MSSTEIHGRPMTSQEIQQWHGRMPTKAERQAFSYWRNLHPDTPLDGKPANEPYDDMYRYLPETMRFMDDLRRVFGDEKAELIELFVDAKIAEFHRDKQD